MVNVFRWPPVKIRGCYFSQEHSVSTSRDMSGGDVVSSAWAPRRIAKLDVSGVLNDGGGYIEALKRQLMGGVNLVRLTTLPSHWNPRWTGMRGQFEVVWEDDLGSVEWTDGGLPVAWTSGASALSGVPLDSGSFSLVRVSGFAPGQLAVYPDEVVTIGAIVTRAMNKAYADVGGHAVISVIGPVDSPGLVSIGVRETGVYRVVNDISTFQTPGQSFGYSLDFREVFEEETDGFQEVNPWFYGVQ